MQVRRGLDEEKRAKRSAYCAARALARTLKGNLGRRVSAYYEKFLDEVKAKFPAVFTAKGQSEFNLEYGVRDENDTRSMKSKSKAKGQTTTARDIRVPGAK